MKQYQRWIGAALLCAAMAQAGVAHRALAAGPTTTTVIVVPPFMPPAVGVPGDFASGFGNGSIAGNGVAKSELYLTPAVLFGRDVTLSEIAGMSYWTKKTGDHVSAPPDWFLALYTKPYAGDVSTPTWYGDRIGTEPYFSINLVETPGAWNQWVTNGTSNKLRFFESTQGAPGATFGSYSDPDWAAFVAANALSGQPRGPQQVLYFSVQTGSAWAAGFTGQVDGFRIELTDGSVANVNFEPVVPCTMACYVNAVTGNDLYGGDTPATAKKTIQAAVTQVSPGGTVIVAAGTYAENVTIPKALTLDGNGIGSTVLQGAGVGSGLKLNGGLSNVTVKELTVQGYNYGVEMFTGPLSNISFIDVASLNNVTHGIWSQAFGITNIAFTRVKASGNNSVGGLFGRGIWLINGVKSGVSITDGEFNNNGLVGIDVSDGNVTGLTITGNTVSGNGDSGIGVLGAKGPGANLIANNSVTNNGRFGIEVKHPTGNGTASGPGSVVVRDNTVSRNVMATDARDYAGIAVFRRSPNPMDNADQPTGVVVSGNTVSGYVRKPVGSTGDGFGIVVEGTGHVVHHNTVSGNNVGIQIQQGNTINTQNTPYFDRGDASPSGATINRNSLTGNTDFDLRNVAAPLTDATCNWFGVPTGPILAKVSGSFTTGPWLITSNLNGACNGGTARGDKQATLASLAPQAGNKNVAKAIEHINRSLTPAYWADDNHLTAKGKKVFEEEKKAVAELMKVSPVPQVAIDALVGVDAALAQTAIDEVDCNGGAKCLEELAKANASMAKAAVDLAAYDYDKAIEDYKKAWEFAMKAAAKAVDPD